MAKEADDIQQKTIDVKITHAYEVEKSQHFYNDVVAQIIPI